MAAPKDAKGFVNKDASVQFAKEASELFARLERETDWIFEEYAQSVQHLPPLERAERWLRDVWERRGFVGEGEEALVYLRSRGLDCAAEIRLLIDDWREAESRIQDSHRGATLSRFWFPAHHETEILDAAMLRAAWWCEVGGFDRWWGQLARSLTEEILRGGIHPVVGSYLLVSLTRADCAREKIPLNRLLEAIELPSLPGEEYPWRQRCGNRGPVDDPLEIRAHLGYAANLAFASSILRERPSLLASRACEALLESQRRDGWWPAWEHWQEPCVETSAVAVHALVLNRPTGWEHAVSRAAEWLLSVQEPGGYWIEKNERSHPPFLTVLVLDALSLSGGSTVVTFGLPPGFPSIGSLGSQPTARRFSVALTFPGEHRNLVERIAYVLASKLGERRILYDKFHEAEFARPNLDTHLQRLYHEESDLVVVVLGADYEKKEWCGLEWRAVRDLIKSREDDRVMFLRTDQGPVAGVFNIDGYIDVSGRDEAELAGLILERLDSIRDK